MSSKIFGPYDVRGRYPGEINAEVVRTIASGLRKYFKKNSKQATILLGRDARLSSPELHRVLKREFGSGAGCRVIDAGLMTTPMFYFLARRLRVSGGVMVTASHNPKNWNGLKVIGKKGEMINGVGVLDLIKHELPESLR